LARQRFIHPDFWTDPSIGRLQPIERLFFIGCFSNADDEGRLLGEPAYLRSSIFPYDDMTLAEILAIRDRVLQICPNLVLYQDQGIFYLAFRKWAQYQQPRYAKKSKLPAPPILDSVNVLQLHPKDENQVQLQPCGEIDESLQPNSCKLAANWSPQIGFRLDRVGLDREMSSSSSLQDQDVLRELASVANYPYEPSKDSAFVAKLRADFPQIDLLAEAKAWSTYKLDKPLQAKSNPRSQFRTWISRAKPPEAPPVPRKTRNPWDGKFTPKELGLV